MSYKTASVIVLGIAGSLSALILFSKQNEQSLIVPISEIPREIIQKAANPQEFLSSAQTVTNDVARAIADDLLGRNPEGPQIDESQPGVMSISALDPDLVASNILTEQIKKVTSEVFSQLPSPTELVLSSTVTDREYLLARGQIIKNAQEKLSSYSAKAFDDATLLALRNAADESLAALKKMPVPVALVAIHAEQIQLLAAQRAIFNNLIDRESDPVAAAISISLLERVDKDLVGLSNKIKAYIMSRS